MDKLLLECFDCDFTREFEGAESFSPVAITVMMHHYNETKHDLQLRIQDPSKVVVALGDPTRAIERVLHG